MQDSQSYQGTVGELVARFLEACNVKTAFGVISIHNMPILDAIGVRDNIRFVPSRGEAGAGNMADAYARVTNNLGVAFTSTGTAAGNAAGAMVEALTAGSPVLHITGQIEVEHLDRDRAYIHEAPDQLSMLEAVSKKAYRIWSPETALGVLRKAAQTALSYPRGPVSIEIPIDVQQAIVDIPEELSPLPPLLHRPQEDDIDALAQAFIKAKRPMLWLGGGARHASKAATRLADMGIAIVTSTNGRAVVPEDHPMSLAAFNASTMAESLYESLDLMVVVGSRLRSNETWTYDIRFPENLIVVDCDPEADGRAYPNRSFIWADSKQILERLADKLEGKLNIDPALADDVATTRLKSVEALKDGLGPYTRMVDELQALMTENTVWVRDVTVSNSTWGNRLLQIGHSRAGVHALGGGIGQGLPMGIGAAIGAGEHKTITLTGDGGLSLCLGEISTAAQENVDMTLLLMNDSGYGVIRNIQDAIYGSRKYFSNIQIPNFEKICESLDVKHSLVSDLNDFSTVMKDAINHKGFSVVEVDMTSIGPFKTTFAGPPKRTK